MAGYTSIFETFASGFFERTFLFQSGFQKSWNVGTANSFPHKSTDAIAETADSSVLSSYNATDTPSELRR